MKKGVKGEGFGAKAPGARASTSGAGAQGAGVRVSICIPTFNRRSLVTRAVDSALAQGCADREVIVVDDGSTDGTGEDLCSRYGDSIRYLYQEQSGPSAARNLGAREARGRYLVFLDSDDTLFPGALESLTLAIERTGYPAAFGTARYEDGGMLNAFRRVGEVHEGDVFEVFLKHKILNNCNYMIEKDRLVSLGGYDETIVNHEDYELFLRLSSQIKFAFSKDDVVTIRRTPGSVRGDDKGIISQGVAPMDRLFSKVSSPRLLALKDTLYAREHLTVARSCYREDMYPEFRENFRKALSLDRSTACGLRFLRRYALSYFYGTFGYRGIGGAGGQPGNRGGE